MKMHISYLLTSAFVILTHSLSAQGTAFTYQGRITDGANPANGSYDLTFTLFSTDSAGNPIAGPVTNNATSVSNGLFTTTIDFGLGVFAGGSNWLEISVSTNAANNFTILAPRQQITPVPYAITAGAVASGGLPAGVYSSAVTFDNADNSFAGSFSGDGTGLNNVNAATLNGLASASFWNVAGNAGANPTNGAFLGTTDTLPLELRVAGSRALRLEYALNPSFPSVVPNLIGGYSGNLVSNGYIGATITGGGDVGVANRVGNDYATVLGGLANTASGNISVAMGNGCTASGDEAIAMGHGTTANGVISTSMGDATTANGLGSVAMGYKSFANGETSLAAGNYAYATFNGSFVWADDSVNSYFSDAAANQFLIRAAGGVGIGTAYPPPGGLNVASGGLAVSGASSPVYYGAKGVFIESQSGYGAIYSFNYTSGAPQPLCLNTPGGNVGVGTSTPAYPLQIVGSCAATTFVTLSDRNAKENFKPVSARDILAKVAALPLSRWNYKEDKTQEHIGPMAQDFHFAFDVGPDDKHITTVDEGGVALAAIQGLNQKVEDSSQDLETRSRRLEAENAELRRQNDSLNSRLSDLEAAVKALAARK
jgi:hypothetical protein